MALNGLSKNNFITAIAKQLSINSDFDTNSYEIKEDTATGNFLITFKTANGETTIYTLTSSGNITSSGDLDMNGNDIIDVGDISATSSLTFSTNGAQKGAFESDGTFRVSSNAADMLLEATGINNSSLFTIQHSNTGIGDTQLLFNIVSGGSFSMGIDNSDSDKFKISDGVSLGTSERLVIDGSGNVGIGTASPSELLQIHEDSIGVPATLKLTNNIFSTGFDVELDGSGNALLRNQESGYMSFYTANTERMRILAASGNVGIGTTSADRKLHVAATTGDVFFKLSTGDDSSAQIEFETSDTGNAFVGFTADFFDIFSAANKTMRLGTNSIIYQGLNTDGVIDSYGTPAQSAALFKLRKSDTNTNNQVFIDFYRSATSISDGTLEGDIRTDGASNLVFLDASSRTLKKNIRDNEESYDVVKNLRSVKFDWEDESKPADCLGFIAEEVQQVYPRATGIINKKIFNEEGEEVGEEQVLGVSRISLIPLMWETIRILQAKVEELENKGK